MTLSRKYLTKLIVFEGAALATDCPDTWIPFQSSCYHFETSMALKFSEAEVNNNYAFVQIGRLITELIVVPTKYRHAVFVLTRLI